MRKQIFYTKNRFYKKSRNLFSLISLSSNVLIETIQSVPTQSSKNSLPLTLEGLPLQSSAADTIRSSEIELHSNSSN